jgi:hypothetical protein
MLREHGCVPLPTEDRLHSDQENLLHPLLRRYPGHRKEQVQPGRGRPPGRSLPIATALVLCVPFGNPAVLVGPVALRPPLARGLPLSRPALSGATSLHLNIVVYGGYVNLLRKKVEWQAPDSTEETTTFGWAVLVDCIWLSTLAGCGRQAGASETERCCRSLGATAD